MSHAGLILQNDEDAPPARLGEWLGARGLGYAVQRLWREPVPDPVTASFVVVLGSAHSARATSPPWIPREIEALRRAVAADVPVLGLCFGAQALSVALGGGVDVLERPEIGWIPVASTHEWVSAGPWLQYHSEQMRVPPGAEELARSPAGPAAFRRGRHLGLQFHPEVDAPLVDRWARSDEKLTLSGITRTQLTEQSSIHAGPAHERAFRLFDAWLEGAGVG
jgi:GMP synthase-like glutamine amidotransferase